MDAVKGDRYILINADCFEILPKIQNRKIDLIFTDPPYDKNDQGLQPLSDSQKQQLAKHFIRIIKKTGNIAIMCGKVCKWKWYNIMTKLGAELHSEVIWCYENPPEFRKPAKSIRSFTWSHDTILCFRISRENYFNRDPEHEWLKHKVSWILAPCVTGFLRGYKDKLPKERLEGVTPRPLEIADKINYFLCPENGIVLDPFMGTGSLILSAYLLRNAKVIGIEKNPNTFKIAVKRFKQYSSQKQLSFKPKNLKTLSL